MPHYFDSTGVKSQIKQLHIIFKGRDIMFNTDNGVFSKTGLDDGSRLLINTFLDLNLKNLKCLDVGCGIGVIGIISNVLNQTLKFDYVDINERAISLTQKNLALNNLTGLVEKSDCLDSVISNIYDIVISNPPIRAGNAVLHKIFEQSYAVLNNGGKFICVLRIKQGAKTYIKFIENLFGNSNIIAKDKGFVVCEFIK